MSGKCDPPDKARLIAANPSISSTCELMVATAEGKFPPKAKRNDSASRAFGLLQKVYPNRAAICGQQQCQTPAPHSWTGPMLEDSQNDYL